MNFKDDKGKVYNERRTVYRHSDGYPDGVLPDLKEFLKWDIGRITDVEYSAANFIYWSKRNYEDAYLEKGRKWNDSGERKCSLLHIGFGVCENDVFHEDIEYFYVVETRHGDNKTLIKVYTHGVKFEDRDKIKPAETSIFVHSMEGKDGNR